MRMSRSLGSLAVLAFFAFAHPVGEASAQTAKPKPAGRVAIDQTQVAFIGSAAVGGGTLHFRGRSYPFTINGLGLGGVGVSKLRATGEVFQLTRAHDLNGIYGQVRIGWALASKGDGRLWLQNDKGVVLRLHSKRRGLMLAGGADAVRIELR